MDTKDRKTETVFLVMLITTNLYGRSQGCSHVGKDGIGYAQVVPDYVEVIHTSADQVQPVCESPRLRIRRQHGEAWGKGGVVSPVEGRVPDKLSESDGLRGRLTNRLEV
jgi:hypothetical protein